MFDFLKGLGKAVADGMGLNAQPNSANSGNAASAPKPQSSGLALQTTPDKPIPFGYKCSWLCVKANSPEVVIEKLGLKNPRVCNWTSAIAERQKGVFVTPVMDGYVIVIGWEGDIPETNCAELDELAKKFTELQFFSTHRVSDYHVWVKYVGGEMIRGYGYCGGDGEVLLNKGAVTPEETELGLDNLLPDNDADWDDYESPDEQNVLDIAAAWGIDTSFTRKTYPESTGFICDVR